ncbi:DUF4870 domain-containing protein [Verrucomicrobium sp. BvORR106]|uniref:DUF4870 domain-containing protein n=1 Tax=Verrucomicrobium sp. BvORR106 TaxID=1403819 RepID=UPI0009DEF8AC|nr:DUF4870 domain-containing protein [Verrucomicrobium sp. BvORR106]
MDSPPPPPPSEGPNPQFPPTPPPAAAEIPPPPPQGPYGSYLPESPGWAASPDERNLALFCHLGSLAGYVLPFGNILVPLILWLVNKDKMPFVNDQGKESVNFQISITIYVVASVVITFITCGWGFPVLFGPPIFSLVMVIIAGLEANKGIAYRYPLCIRMIN